MPRKKKLTTKRLKAKKKTAKTQAKFNGSAKKTVLRTSKERNEKLKQNRERRYLQRQLKKIGLKYDINDRLDIEQHHFNVYMKSLQWHQCPHCNRKVVQIPIELQNLTFIEKQLIARVHSAISLYKFKKSQVINFSQDVQTVADRKPHLVENLDNVMVVKLRNAVHSEDLAVRKDKVLNALLWLKEDNPYYSDITIGYENLDTLPVNGSVVDDLKQIDPSNIDDSNEDEYDQVGNSDIIFSHVPDTLNTSVKKSFSNYLIWPSLGTTPLNEFSSPGYISLCFPHVFPYAKADYSIPRPHKIKLSDYIHHLMSYEDGRFSKDERFRYFMIISHMRWTSLKLGNVYV
ncbi:Glycerophosphoinositol inositolphosphodiesterase GDPD2 [Frankliniella fusca]|uniref:Glycerophosphoinositol inositolphosphodiesterase GDPD2 n=1 Tax=Frankliniella fusca TaxID=407009 RepID=A0AAE1LAC9_9NEOP|nr:Glycerophosphoinositol inositolphosphodiesterase GDPD2 [Frankliniella fusca]